MNSQSESPQPPTSASAPENAHAVTATTLPEANAEQMIALPLEIAERLTDIHDLQYEQLHVLRSINSGLP